MQRYVYISCLAADIFILNLKGHHPLKALKLVSAISLNDKLALMDQISVHCNKLIAGH
jgi:predicted alpha/beta-hydrolase family hydrolase